MPSSEPRRFGRAFLITLAVGLLALVVIRAVWGSNIGKPGGGGSSTDPSAFGEIYAAGNAVATPTTVLNAWRQFDTRLRTDFLAAGPTQIGFGTYAFGTDTIMALIHWDVQ